MAHFGPRVIGRAQHAEEAQVDKLRANHFGPRVIGKIFKDVVPAAVEKDSRSDPAKKAAKKQAAVPKVEAPITANLQELESALGSNATFYEPLFVAELERAEGPRKGGLRIFLAHELSLDVPNEERIKQIEDLL
jgi:hypothetical protein